MRSINGNATVMTRLLEARSRQEVAKHFTYTSKLLSRMNHTFDVLRKVRMPKSPESLNGQVLNLLIELGGHMKPQTKKILERSGILSTKETVKRMMENNTKWIEEKFSSIIVNAKRFRVYSCDNVDRIATGTRTLHQCTVYGNGCNRASGANQHSHTEEN
jgi:hypothetical protein